MKLLSAFALAMLLAVPAYAAEPKPEPVRLDAAQLDTVSAGIFRLPRVDSIIRVPRLPRVPSVGRLPSVDRFIDLRALLGRD